MSGHIPRPYWRLGAYVFRKQNKKVCGSQLLSPVIRAKSSSSGSSGRKFGIDSVAMLALPATCFGLGVWQVQRRQWKLGIIDQIEARVSAPPVPLPDNLRDLTLEDNEYLKVRVRGRFDHSKEMYINMRRDLNNEDAKDMGVYVITPFVLADRPQSILVNRGHVPFRIQSPDDRKEGQVEGEVEIIGFNRFKENQPPFSTNDTETRMFVNRDIDLMSALTGSVPIYIDENLETSIPGGPVGGQTRVHIRNEHLQYICTWFGLCLCLSWLWYRRYFNPVKYQSVFSEGQAIKRKGLDMNKKL